MAQRQIRSFKELQRFEVITLVVDDGGHGLPAVDIVTEAVVAYIAHDETWLITCGGRLITWHDIKIIRKVTSDGQTRVLREDEQHISARSRQLNQALNWGLEEGRPGDPVVEI